MTVPYVISTVQFKNSSYHRWNNKPSPVSPVMPVEVILLDEDITSLALLDLHLLIPE